MHTSSSPVGSSPVLQFAPVSQRLSVPPTQLTEHVGSPDAWPWIASVTVRAASAATKVFMGENVGRPRSASSSRSPKPR